MKREIRFVLLSTFARTKECAYSIKRFKLSLALAEVAWPTSQPPTQHPTSINRVPKSGIVVIQYLLNHVDTVWHGRFLVSPYAHGLLR